MNTVTAATGKRLVAVTGSVALTMGALVVASPTADATTVKKGTVMVKTQRMSAATLKSNQSGWYSKRSKLTLTCYARGQAVKGYYSKSFPGGWDNLWYKVSDKHWVADVDVYTGSNKPVTKACTKPKSTSPSKRYNAGIIKAANRWSSPYGGQCLWFVTKLIRSAGGPSLAFGLNVNTYQSQWAKHAKQVSWAQSAPGDIIQWYDPRGTYSKAHTAVLTSGKGASTARVVDSNYGLQVRERVSRGTFSSRHYGFHSGTYKIWRVK